MNKVFLIGNLTRDPELRTTPSGVGVCSFSIAVNRKFQGKTGEKKTDYFDIITWRSLAELCGKYLSKGRKVAVVGELQNRSYETKDGTKRYVTEILASEVEFLSPVIGSTEGHNKRQEDLPDDIMDGFREVEDDDFPF